MKKKIKVIIFVAAVLLLPVLYGINEWQLYQREKNTYEVELKQEMFQGVSVEENSEVPDYIFDYILEGKEEVNNGESGSTEEETSEASSR